MKAQHWLSKCITDDKGRALPILANAFTALEFDPLLRDAIAYDEMQCAPMLLHQIGQLVGGDVDHPRPLTDKDISDVQKYLPGWNGSVASRSTMRWIPMRGITAITPCATTSKLCNGTARPACTLG
jgi:hypothetical protein